MVLTYVTGIFTIFPNQKIYFLNVLLNLTLQLDNKAAKNINQGLCCGKNGNQGYVVVRMGIKVYVVVNCHGYHTVECYDVILLISNFSGINKGRREVGALGYPPKP